MRLCVYVRGVYNCDPAHSQHQIRDVFSLIDKNGDGKLSVKELAAYDKTTKTRAPAAGRERTGTKRYGERKAEGFLEMLQKECAVNFESFDTDGDGMFAPAL